MFNDGTSTKATLPTECGTTGCNKIMCAWPPNFKYYCVLDAFKVDGLGNFVRTELLPISDNCGTQFPLTVGPSGFSCSDTDPRSQPGVQHSSLPHLLFDAAWTYTRMHVDYSATLIRVPLAR